MNQSPISRRSRGWAIELSLKQAIRRLLRAPSFALPAILTLALCLGGNATLLSFLVTLTWRAQPGIRNGRSLVHVTLRDTQGRLTYAPPSEVQALRGAGARSIAIASYAPTFSTIGGTRTTTERALIEFTSPAFFHVLGTRAIKGRLLTAQDSIADVETPVVISERLWTTTFATRADIIGQRVYVDGSPGVIVGVSENGFHGPEGLVQADAWLPMTDPAKEYGSARIVARLRPGSDIAAARGELRVIWQNVARQEALRREALGLPLQQTSLVVSPLRAGLHPEQAPVMQRLLGGAIAVALLVLLIACMNLAGLTLSRVLARGPEVAVRTALGSSRAQLWVDIGAELGVLFLVGTGAGLLIASFIGRALMRAMTQPFPFTLDVRLDGPTLALSLGLTALAVIAATLAPGLHAMRISPANALRVDARSVSVSKTVRRVQGAFVIAQLTSAIVLVAGVVSAVVTAGHILEFNIGVTSPETLISVERVSSGTTVRSGEQSTNAMLDRIRQLPAVSAAVTAYQVPAGGSLLGARMRRVASPSEGGAPADSGWEATMNVVSAGYFAAIGAPMLRGREFTASDDSSNVGVAVLSRSAATQLFPGVDAVGRELVQGDSGQRVAIVGVAADVLYDPSHPDELSVVYLAARQTGSTGERTILARVRAPASASRRAIDAALATGSSAPVASPQSVDELLRESTRSLKAIFTLLIAAAALAVGLALSGVYGMVAYGARRREREIGVRLALGAGSTSVALSFVRGVLGQATLAAVAAMLVWPIAERILPETMQADVTAQWAALIAGAVVLGVAAVSASFAATWQPSHADPVRALRAD